MAKETAVGTLTASYDSANFPAIATAIEEQAYIMLYENTLLPKLCKRVGEGQKGTAIHYPYFDPTAIATSASISGALTETTDITARVQLTNASVFLVASEFGVQSFITDTLKESGSFNFQEELTRQQGIGVAVKFEKHCIARLQTTSTADSVSSFTAMLQCTATTPGQTGLTYTKIAAAKTRLDASLVEVPGEKQLVIPDYAYYWTAQGTYSTTYQAAIPTFGDEVLKRWYITTAFGDVNIFRNNHFTIAASKTMAFMFVKDAVALWQPRDYRLEPQRDASARGDELNSSMRAGCKILHKGFGVRLNVYAGLPS